MAIEIERKFLVQSDEWRALGTGQLYRQGYLPRGEGCTMRVRVVGSQGYLTLKGVTQGISKLEFEYPIPLADAEDILAHLCDRPLIEKTRYKIPIDGLVWEVDEFAGENTGLIMAEVELSHPDQSINCPSWIGEEVSHDPRYFNAYLAQHPYSSWATP